MGVPAQPEKCNSAQGEEVTNGRTVIERCERRLDKLKFSNPSNGFFLGVLDMLQAPLGIFATLSDWLPC